MKLERLKCFEKATRDQKNVPRGEQVQAYLSRLSFKNYHTSSLRSSILFNKQKSKLYHVRHWNLHPDSEQLDRFKEYDHNSSSSRKKPGAPQYNYTQLTAIKMKTYVYNNCFTLRSRAIRQAEIAGLGEGGFHNCFFLSTNIWHQQKMVIMSIES